MAERFRPTPDYFLTVRGDSMDRTGLRDGDVAAIRATPVAKSGDVVVARFGDEVTLKRFVRIDTRHVELRPDSRNPVHQPIEIDLAKHILHIDGVAVGALIRGWERRRKRERERTGPTRSIDGIAGRDAFDVRCTHVYRVPEMATPALGPAAGTRPPSSGRPTGGRSSRRQIATRGRNTS